LFLVNITQRLKMEAIKTTGVKATQVATKYVNAFGTAAANANLEQINILKKKRIPTRY
jgi:hypothetical protein